MNPQTDFHCLTTFGSYFTRDIPIPMVRFNVPLFQYFCYETCVFSILGAIIAYLLLQGTTIDFRQTADGRLITKSRFYLVSSFIALSCLMYIYPILTKMICVQLVANILALSTAKICAVS